MASRFFSLLYAKHDTAGFTAPWPSMIRFMNPKTVFM